MASPSHPVLQQIQHLDHSIPEFHNQLDDVLHGRDYTQCVQHLGKDDLLWLVSYLDQVFRGICFYVPRSIQPHRLSMNLNPPVLLLGSASAS